MKQKEAICKRCGREIWLIECSENGKWISCDKELRSFTPSGGPETYVDETGKLIRGSGIISNHIMVYGYRKHRKDCGNAKVR